MANKGDLALSSVFRSFWKASSPTAQDRLHACLSATPVQGPKGFLWCLPMNWGWALKQMAAHIPFSRIPCAPQRMQPPLKPEEWYSPELTHAGSGMAVVLILLALPVSLSFFYDWNQQGNSLSGSWLPQDFHRINCSAEKVTREIFRFNFSQCRRILAISQDFCKFSCLNFEK